MNYHPGPGNAKKSDEMGFGGRLGTPRESMEKQPSDNGLFMGFHKVFQSGVSGF